MNKKASTFCKAIRFFLLPRTFRRVYKCRNKLRVPRFSWTVLWIPLKNTYDQKIFERPNLKCASTYWALILVILCLWEGIFTMKYCGISDGTWGSFEKHLSPVGKQSASKGISALRGIGEGSGNFEYSFPTVFPSFR